MIYSGYKEGFIFADENGQVRDEHGKDLGRRSRSHRTSSQSPGSSEDYRRYEAYSDDEYDPLTD